MFCVRVWLRSVLCLSALRIMKFLLTMVSYGNMCIFGNAGRNKQLLQNVFWRTAVPRPMTWWKFIGSAKLWINFTSSVSCVLWQQSEGCEGRTWRGQKRKAIQAVSEVMKPTVVSVLVYISCVCFFFFALKLSKRKFAKIRALTSSYLSACKQ